MKTERKETGLGAVSVLLFAALLLGGLNLLLMRWPSTLQNYAVDLIHAVQGILKP